MNHKPSSDPRYFYTSNFYLAAFLFAKGLELANVDRLTDKRRATFVFIESPRREEIMHTFNFAQEDDEDVVVDARKLIQAIKGLKDKLYQNDY